MLKWDEFCPLDTLCLCIKIIPSRGHFGLLHLDPELSKWLCLEGIFLPVRANTWEELCSCCILLFLVPEFGAWFFSRSLLFIQSHPPSRRFLSPPSLFEFSLYSAHRGTGSANPQMHLPGCQQQRAFKAGGIFKYPLYVQLAFRFKCSSHQPTRSGYNS